MVFTVIFKYVLCCRGDEYDATQEIDRIKVNLMMHCLYKNERFV